MPGLGKY